MSLDADQIVDRRRLRRKLSFWRFLAVVLVIVAIGAGLWAVGFEPLDRRPAQIARVELTGVITDNREQIELLNRVAEADHVEALIVSIDSPGGTTAGAEAMERALRKVAAGKPVVAQLGTLATSGGYAAALGADHIVARGNTITGSIGVLVQWADVTELMESIGVDMESVKSGPLKAAPSPFEPATEEARETLRALVLDSHDWFVTLVAERRGIDAPRARQLGDGRVMTGRQALAVGLVDALGGEEEARDWLAEVHNIDRDLPLRDWRRRSTFGGLGAGAGITWLARAAGFEGIAGAIERRLALGGLGLDGLVSVWHPQTIEE